MSSAQLPSQEREPADAGLPVDASDIAQQTDTVGVQEPARDKRWIRWLVGSAIAISVGAISMGSWFYLHQESARAPATGLFGNSTGGMGIAMPSGRHGSAPALDTLVDKLALRMREQTPDDAQGWALLGRTYAELRRYPEAVDAFAQAAKRLPGDAALLADYAIALAAVQGSYAGEPAQLADRAMKIDANQPKVLYADGRMAFEQKDYARALRQWQRAEPMLANDPPMRAAIAEDIARVQAIAAGAGPSR
ncbi:MAG TPA: hypothetical protein VMV45_19400 [Casimicrobiaceae bacterium]|nr:hypothetical protein [Casimicrobiaceae bacterium]